MVLGDFHCQFHSPACGVQFVPVHVHARPPPRDSVPVAQICRCSRRPKASRVWPMNSSNSADRAGATPILRALPMRRARLFFSAIRDSGRSSILPIHISHRWSINGNTIHRIAVAIYSKSPPRGSRMAIFCKLAEAFRIARKCWNAFTKRCSPPSSQ